MVSGFLMLCGNLVVVDLAHANIRALQTLKNTPSENTTWGMETKMSDRYQKREIRVIKLDDLIDEYNLKGDILLKVDVQGYELEVLEGA